MKLPTRAIRKMAGDPLVIDGRTLDPRIQLIANSSADQPDITTMTPAEARESAAKGFALMNSKRPAGVAVENRTIPGPDGPLPVRLYRPESSVGNRPAVLFLHQGGFVIGDLETDDPFCAQLSAALGGLVMSVDYRLAPRYQFPAQLADTAAAWDWMRSNADALGIDADRIGVCGDSAGAQLSAALCQRLRGAGQPQPRVQVLVYPFVDATAETGSMVSCANSFPLTDSTMGWFEEQYLPPGMAKDDPMLSVALATDLVGLAPAVVITAGFDPLRDQGMAYAEALRMAGVRVISREEPSLSHSFLSMGGVIPAARRATSALIDDIVSALDQG